MKEDIRLDSTSNLPLREVVFLRLRQAILQGELQPGERLMEIQLANQLGVSRTPIREAIRKLELEGLVSMKPRRGAEVASITIKDMQDVLEVRGTLEELAVELCCAKEDDSWIEELKNANKVFEAAVKSGELLIIADADVNFHDIIYKATGNRRLIQIVNNLREQIYRYRLEYIKNEEARKELIEEHEKIIGYISRKDKDGAKEAMRKHIANQEKDIAGAIKRHES